MQIHVVKVFVNNEQEIQDLRCPLNLKHIPYLIVVKEYKEPIIGESCIIYNSTRAFFFGKCRANDLGCLL